MEWLKRSRVYRFMQRSLTSGVTTLDLVQLCKLSGPGKNSQVDNWPTDQFKPIQQHCVLCNPVFSHLKGLS